MSLKKGGETLSRLKHAIGLYVNKYNKPPLAILVSVYIAEKLSSEIGVNILGLDHKTYNDLVVNRVPLKVYSGRGIAFVMSRNASVMKRENKKHG